MEVERAAAAEASAAAEAAAAGEAAASADEAAEAAARTTAPLLRAAELEALGEGLGALRMVGIGDERAVGKVAARREKTSDREVLAEALRRKLVQQVAEEAAEAEAEAEDAVVVGYGEEEAEAEEAAETAEAAEVPSSAAATPVTFTEAPTPAEEYVSYLNQHVSGAGGTPPAWLRQTSIGPKGKREGKHERPIKLDMPAAHVHVTPPPVGEPFGVTRIRLTDGGEAAGGAAAGDAADGGQQMAAIGDDAVGDEGAIAPPVTAQDGAPPAAVRIVFVSDANGHEATQSTI